MTVAEWKLLIVSCMNISPKPAKQIVSAKFLVCFNFQTDSMSLKDGENDVGVSNSLDTEKMLSYLVSRPDLS